MRPIRFTAAALGLLALTACATTDVRSFVQRGMDVTRYSTYTWGPGEARATGDARLDSNPFFEERMQRAVEKQLDARGFEKSNLEVPDLFVHYHASVRQEINANGADQPYVTCEDCQPYVYDAGTIVVDLIDARSGRLVWRGWEERSIDGVVDDQAWMEKTVDEAVARILGQLPDRVRRVS